MPALVTRISTGPSSLRTRANAASTEPRSATSTSTATRRVPAGAQLGGGRLGGRAVPVEDRDAVAVAASCCGDAEADAGRTTGDDGDAAHRAASTRRELEVQLGEAAQDPGRLVAEAASAGGPWCSSDRRMSRMRSRMRSRLIRPSARASGRTRAGMGPAPERDVAPRRSPVDVELGRAFEPLGVTVRGAVEQHHRRPRRRSRPRRPSCRGGRAGSRT